MIVKNLITTCQKMSIIFFLFFAIFLHANEKVVLGITGVALKDDISTLMNLKEYLSEKTGFDIKFKFSRSYSAMESFILDKNVDFAYVCGSTFVDLKETNKIELLALPIIDGKPSYYALIIAKKDSAFNSIEDFKGKIFAMSDPKSNSGYLVPKYELLKKNLDIESFFQKNIFTYDHGESITAVLSGYVDGASVDSVIYEAFILKNPELAKHLKIVERFGPYPVPPIIIRKQIPEQIKDKIQMVFLGMNQDEKGKSILKSMAIERFSAPDGASYQKIEQIKQFIKEAK